MRLPLAFVEEFLDFVRPACSPTGMIERCLSAFPSAGLHAAPCCPNGQPSLLPMGRALRGCGLGGGGLRGVPSRHDTPPPSLPRPVLDTGVLGRLESCPLLLERLVTPAPASPSLGGGGSSRLTSAPRGAALRCAAIRSAGRPLKISTPAWRQAAHPRPHCLCFACPRWAPRFSACHRPHWSSLPWASLQSA